ncbi:MAG: thioredoxin family protein [Syntrophomonadaceae bacterium]|nr:thioredoxin family protein [Syntrophomonadaceae bacterium]
MSKKLGLGILIVIALLIAYKTWGGYDNKSVDIPENLSAAVQFEEAQKNGQPVWLMFGTNNCPYCVELKKIYDELKPQYEGKVVFIDVNLDKKENHDLGREYQIRYVPVTCIYDKDGNITFYEGGLLEKEVLIRELDKVALE